MRAFLLLILFIATIEPQACLAQSTKVIYPKNNIVQLSTKLDHVATVFQQNRHFMGTIFVAKDNNILLEKAYGMADLEWNVPDTIDTKFRLGSITKQFTAAAILQLAEQHKLSISDPACNYIDGCPQAWKKITIEQLLSHTSGIPSYTDDKNFVYTASRTPAEILFTTKNKPLDFTPGTQWKYDNSGYVFLGMIIEKVSGETYADYIKQHIFNPLHMTNSGYDDPSMVLYHRASGYKLCGESFCNANYIDMSIPFAAGALYSTVEDLYQWDRALYTDKILNSASRSLMFTNVKNNYGFGWDLTSMANHKQMGHNGGINGFNSYIARFPEDNAVIIVLSNVEINTRVLTIALANTLLGESVTLPTKIKQVSIDTSTLNRYIGNYRTKTKPLFITVTNEKGHLMIAVNGQSKLEAIPLSKTQFIVEQVAAVFTFITDSNGKVTAVKLEQGGLVVVGDRIN